MPTRGSKNPNGRALRGRRAYTTFISDPIAQLWSNYNVRAGATGAIAPEQPAVQNCLYDRFDALYKKSSIRPSLLIVPARFQGGSLYSQIPTSGAGDFTVTRATTATRVNASGLIESVASGIPRLDYFASGGTVGCPALLVEPSGTNLARFVNQMTAQDTPAASGGMTTTTGSTDFLAPDGTSGSITKYVGGAASGTNQYAYYTGGGIAASASGAHTYSLFVRPGAINPLNFCALGLENYAGGSGTIYSYFNLASGTALTAGASVQNYGNGWYRLTTPPYTLASGDLTGTLSFFMAEGNGDLSWPVSGALNLTAYTWGSQFEAGSVATSYIPTTTGSVTRNADVISVSGAVSGSIGQTQGTIYAEFEHTSNTAERRLIALSDGTSTNRIFIWAINNILYAQIQGNSTIIANSIPSGYNKVAFAYQQNGVSGNLFATINGGAVVSGTSTTYPSTLSRLALGNSENVGATFQWNNRIRAAALYTTRLTDAELAALTSL